MSATARHCVTGDNEVDDIRPNPLLSLPMDKTFSSAGSDEIENYVTGEFKPEDPILAEIRERSATAGLPDIQVGKMDSLHLEVITRAIGAKKAVEIGTLGGYSGTAILRGLGQGGRLYTFEYEPLHAEVARESFRKAGFEKQVEIFVGPALDNLSRIEKEGPFDLVFCDADKVNYSNYLDWAAKNLKVGGVLLGDNTLGWGAIGRTDFKDHPHNEEFLQKTVPALRRFNHGMASGERFRSTLLPTGEGLTMGVKIR